MIVHVRLHTTLRKETPQGIIDRVDLELGRGATLADVLARLEIRPRGGSVLMAVNGNLVKADHVLNDGDQVRLGPSGSGGQTEGKRGWLWGGGWLRIGGGRAGGPGRERPPPPPADPAGPPAIGVSQSDVNASDERPGVGPAVVGGERKLARGEQAFGPSLQGARFFEGEQGGEALVRRTAGGELRPESFDGLQDLRRDPLAGEVPDHGAKLVVLMEAEAVIDEPDVALRAEEHVPALAVGVVDEDVECRHRTEALLFFLAEGEVVAFGVGVGGELGG